MLEFIFFHNTPMQRFQKFLRDLNIPYKNDTQFQESIDEVGLTVSINDDHELEIINKVEDFYDEMMNLTETIVSAEEDDKEIKNAGISVTLSDGKTVLADVDPELVYKLSSALSANEILHLVNAIVDAVENPDSRPLCER